jgi:tetratricopeptide (TPR) repeat protein
LHKTYNNMKAIKMSRILVIAVVLIAAACGNSEEKKNKEYNSLLEQAKSAADKRDYVNAILFSSKAITLDSTEAEGYEKRYLYYNKRANQFDAKDSLEREKYELKALADLNKLVYLKPTLENYRERAGWLESEGNYEAALKDYDQVIRMNDKHYNAYSERAYIKFWKLYDSAGAFADLKKAKEINSNAIKAKGIECSIYEELGQWQKNIEVLSVVNFYTDSTSDLINYLVAAKYMVGDYYGALVTSESFHYPNRLTLYTTLFGAAARIKLGQVAFGKKVIKELSNRLGAYRGRTLKKRFNGRIILFGNFYLRMCEEFPELPKVENTKWAPHK